jgi:hypothetical protein
MNGKNHERTLQLMWTATHTSTPRLHRQGYGTNILDADTYRIMQAFEEKQERRKAAKQAKKQVTLRRFSWE